MKDENEFNPFASPAVAVACPSPREFRVHGDCVVVTSGCKLPLRCIATNAPCDVDDQNYQRLTYAPSFRLVINRRTCYLTYCTHPKLRKPAFLVRCFVSLVSFLAIAWMLPGAIIMPVSVAVAAFFIVPRDRLKIVNHKNGEYWIKGFSESFLDSLVTVDNWKRV